MAVFRETDAFSGKEARAYITLDDRREELFFARSLEATIEKNKVDVPVLGRSNTPKRASGWNGTGTLNLYYVTSTFRSLMQRYTETGQDFWFDLMVVNEQPGSAAGKQVVHLKGCNLDSVIATRFDVSSDDMLEEELPFTFSEYVVEQEFNPLPQ